MSAQTVNQIINSIDSFASAHQQIHSFGKGNITDFATSGDTRYYSVWVDVLPTTINFSNQNTNTYTTSLRIYVLSRLAKGGTNYIEVISDSQSIVLDMVAYLGNPSTAFEWVLEASAMNPVGDPQFDDELAGQIIDLNFRQYLTRDRCAIPFTTDPTPI